jgi:predicted enzyme related to lactoylglutathione lyase
MTFAGRLGEWLDVEGAEHVLATALGIMPRNSVMVEAKPVYWSNHPLGNELFALLERLTELGFLEKRDEPELQYRVRADFTRKLGIEEIWTKKRLFPLRPALNLVVLPSKDPLLSSRFYQALGLCFAPVRDGNGLERYSARLDNTVLEFQATEVPAPPTQLGLAVPDVGAAVAAVREFGGAVVRIEVDPVRSAFVQDPDGNTIHLTTAE